MKIAIIGAGVSGLTTAHYLRKGVNPEVKQADITIFEKADKVGGNADTFWIDLPNGTGTPIKRWVDMGVNDFNLGTYMALRQLWQDIGIMSKDGDCPTSFFCKPLINAESFAKPGDDGAYKYRYYINESGKVIAPGDSTAKADILERDIERFKDELANWYSVFEQEGKSSITVGDWLKSINMPFSDEFINNNLYPRINGMYFTLEEFGDRSQPPPAAIPLWMVAHYYILQEAYGQKIAKCPRQYFVDGSSNWLEYFAKKLKTGFDGKQKGVEILFNVPPITAHKADGGKIALHITGHEYGIYDKVIFATHADVTHQMLELKFGDDQMVKQLPAFKFATCDIYAHQDRRFLAQGDFNQTYNIHIYDYKKPNSQNPYPYSISYIVNMHQNDPKNPEHKNDPLFFLSINPYWLKSGEEPANMLYQTDEQGKPLHRKASTTMKHCKLDVAAMKAQVSIQNIQLARGSQPLSFYFAGSFARGAGLHMECILQARDIANKISNPVFVSEDIYDFSGSGERHFAPKYVLDAITRIKKKD